MYLRQQAISICSFEKMAVSNVTFITFCYLNYKFGRAVAAEYGLSDLRSDVNMQQPGQEGATGVVLLHIDNKKRAIFGARPASNFLAYKRFIVATCAIFQNRADYDQQMRLGEACR
jgi:hypothetical protein